MNKMFNRPRRHNNNGSVRSARSVALQQITRFTNLDSSGPLGKLRGTPLQLVEKYQTGAKDAHMQGDVILAQTCLQYADHYLRLQNIAIENEQAKVKQEPEVVTESTAENTENSSVQPEEKAPVVSEEPVASQPIVEKKPVIRHKKVVENNLSMPMDALQQKSESPVVADK